MTEKSFIRNIFFLIFDLMVGNCFTQNQLFESKFIDSLNLYRGECFKYFTSY